MELFMCLANKTYVRPVQKSSSISPPTPSSHLTHLTSVPPHPSHLLLHEDDEDVTEHVHKVDKQHQRVPDVVAVSPAAALDDKLGVVQDETAEQKQAAVQLDLVTQTDTGHSSI